MASANLGPESGALRRKREQSWSGRLRLNPLPYLARRTICTTRQGKQHWSEIQRTRPSDEERFQMKTTQRPATTSHSWLGVLGTAALALGAVSATALAAEPAGATGGKQVTVSVTTIGKSKILTASGKPLYVLKPSSVTCGSGCLKIWPALTLPASVSSATAGKGVQSAKLGTTAGPNGLMQVTYGGQPVYWFFKDKVGGKATGNITDKWGKWTAVTVSKGSSGSSGSGSGSSGNSGGTSAGSGGASF